MVTLGADDAGEILTPQRAAYVTEAILHDDLALPPLTQTLDERSDELTDPAETALGIRSGARLVGCVRLRVDGAMSELGRLVVAPDLQGRGLGTRLLGAVDENLPGSVTTVELFTGERSVANLRLYARLGYAETHRRPVGAYSLVFMSRARRARL